MNQTKQKPKKKHHFVPKFYLEGFTDHSGSELVWVYQKGSDTVFSDKPENIGFIKNYHTFTDEQGEKDSGIIEDILNKIWEAPTSEIIGKIKNGNFPESEERDLFASFLGLSLTRVPSHRENVEKVVSNFALKMSKQVAENPKHFEKSLENYERDTGIKLTEDPEDLRNFILSGEYDISVNPTFYLSMFMLHGHLFGEIIDKMNWIFVEATGRFKFITSDNPLFYFDPTYNPKGFYSSIGLANKNIELTFPVSSEVALFATWNTDRKECFLQANNELVKQINRRTIMSAKRFIYASERKEGTLRLVKKYSNFRMELRIT